MQIKIGIVGGGSWGTAIGRLLAGKGENVTIWAHEKEVVDSINNKQENKLFLPDIKLPENLKATNKIEEAIDGKDVVVMATPSQFMRTVLSEIAYLFQPGCYIVLLSKGIENGTLKLMHQVAEENLPDSLHKNIFVLSGPTFARELSMEMPSAAVIASYNTEGIGFVQQLFATDYFRTYRSTDVLGVELGGTLKNIIAISVGILEGLGLGMNSRAALMTRAIAEISRLAIKMGANPFTITGLSGIGDMILTCTGDLSRNKSVGVRLGRGEKIKDILDSMIMVAEGVTSTVSAYDLSRKIEVSMPIVEAVYQIVHDDKNVKEVFSNLMKRQLKEEFYGYSS